MAEAFLNGRVTLHCGDCLDVLATLPECSVDSVVTDPPYHLTSIVKRFGSPNAAPCKEYPGYEHKGQNGNPYVRTSTGFMGRIWDGGDIAFRPETWAEVLRVLKPGGHLLAFGGTRTFARMSVAIEDAGFEIRDTIAWVYGQGFPKSHCVSKGIDRLNGDERPVVGSKAVSRVMDGTEFVGGNVVAGEIAVTAAASAAWEGWGTALKPALEPIVMARKPLSEKTVVANVLRWGCGAINVGACRVPFEDTQNPATNPMFRKQNGYKLNTGNDSNSTSWKIKSDRREQPAHEQGRWPANLIHDGSEEVVGAFPQVGNSHPPDNEGSVRSNQIYGIDRRGRSFHPGFADSGSAARFFYSAKADGDDRLGSKHPTVKPVDLMQYLVRLVTPPGGICLDPFAGTGTTGEAAWREGMRAILIEAEAEYQADVRRRMELALAGPDEKVHAIIKAKGLTESPGPLFDAVEYNALKDIEGSFAEAYRAIRERVAAGGPGWTPRCDSTDDLFGDKGGG